MFRYIASICLLASLGCESKTVAVKVAATPAAPRTAATAPKTAAKQSDIRILAWNIESGGSSSSKILEQLINEMPKADILALSEVPPEDDEQSPGAGQCRASN